MNSLFSVETVSQRYNCDTSHSGLQSSIIFLFDFTLETKDSQSFKLNITLSVTGLNCIISILHCNLYKQSRGPKILIQMLELGWMVQERD